MEHLDNSCLDVADIPPHHSEYLADDVPLMEFKTEVEEEELEVSMKKRRARETTTGGPHSALPPRASAGLSPPLVESESEFDIITEDSDSEEYDSESPISNTVVPQTPRSTTVQQNQQTWSSESFTPITESFNESSSGLNINFTLGNNSELDIFEYFLDTHIVTQIVDHINQFHNYFMVKKPLYSSSRLQRWHDVTPPEFYIFIAVLMLMTRNNHLTIEEHWSSDPLLLAPVFGTLMSRNRFCSILGMLHFSNPIQRNTNSKLEKIELIINDARQKYKSLLTPYRNLCVDEIIVPFKGRLSIKQYLPKKRNQFGIKLFVLCDVTTGIIIDFIVYCGATSEITDPANLGVGGAVTVTLIKDFFESYRHLYVDNWFTSPNLFKYLHENKIYACGTVKPYREAVLNNMGSVDTADMLLSSVQCIRKTSKWYKKLFFNVVDMHLLNAFNTYKIVTDVSSAHIANFQINLIRQIIEKYNPLLLTHPQVHRSNNINPLRILPGNTVEHMPQITQLYRNCKECGKQKRRKQTRYICPICNVYLCAAPCFHNYHSK